ncbi:MAG: hypothetical protein J6X79_04105 [Bacteroidales bacterium]|nr:hypothetical protein [Bacteroidales bacterium]
MSIVSYIVIALAMGIVNMLLFRRCGEATPVRLSAGLLIVLAVSAIHVVLYYLGSRVGSLLSLHSPDDPYMYADVNAYIFLGLTLMVIIKMFAPYLRKVPRLPLFNLGDRRSVVAMAVATGINVLLVGIGTGFVEQGHALHKIVWPLLTASLLLGYLGLMFGRQKVQLRPRRWMVVACVLLLGTAIAACVNA